MQPHVIRRAAFCTCRAAADIEDDIERLEAAGAFGGGGFGRHPVDVLQLSPECAAIVAVLAGSFRRSGLLKTALKGYAGMHRPDPGYAHEHC
jgi:hypothetical protein